MSQSEFRRARGPWPYWVVVPLCSIGYATASFFYTLDAWSRRGMPKPWWYELAFWLTLPGSVVPVIGPLVFGGFVGFASVWLVRSRRAKPKARPRRVG